MKEHAQTTLSRILAIGVPFVSLIVMTGSVTDPVNAPKLLILGGVAFSSFFVFIGSFIGRNREKFSKLEILILVFLTWALVVSFLSKSPLSQNIYGVYGRNTGFLTYFFLCLIFLAASKLSTEKQIKLVVTGFITVLGVNLAYGLWVKVFGDFIAWNNQYKALLGTFGNPNFISAFLGIALGPLLSFVIKGSWKVRLCSTSLISLTIFELYQTASIQGFVVGFVGIWLIAVAVISSKFRSNLATGLVVGFGLSAGVVAIFGAMGQGPLARMVEQPTIALRQQYWYAAWKMGIENPLFGVGMDSYGDWYRHARGAGALVRPGPETVTNVAHNVFLDIFSYGGFPLLCIYFLIVGWPTYIAIKTLCKFKNFDSVQVSVATIFLGYQIQSLISINQIGLAVWGWVSGGLLIALQKSNNSTVVRVKNTLNRSSSSQVFSPSLQSFIGLLIGLIVSCPPISADMKWTSALKSREVSQVEEALAGGYLYPRNSIRLAQAVETLENSKLPKIAIRYARLGTEFNPKSTDAWKMLYYATESTQQEKLISKNKLIELDPLNPNWKKLS